MFFTADQLVAHAVGDYVLQSDWMAQQKTKNILPATVHALVYSLVFAAWFRPSWKAWAIICVTHFFIDRYRLARFVVYAKNFLAPPRTFGPIDMFGGSEDATWWYPWSECSSTGYHKDRPAWLAVWLLIIGDNVMHVVINGLALRYL